MSYERSTLERRRVWTRSTWGRTPRTRRRIYNTNTSLRRSTRDKQSKQSACAAILLLVCVGLSAWPARAESQNRVTHLKAGEPAPFTGDLFPVETALRLGLKIERCSSEAGINLRHTQALHLNELKRCQDKGSISRESDKERIKILTAALEESTSWYRSPAFVATVSVAITVSAILTSAIILEKTLGSR